MSSLNRTMFCLIYRMVRLGTSYYKYRNEVNSLILGKPERQVDNIDTLPLVWVHTPQWTLDRGWTRARKTTETFTPLRTRLGTRGQDKTLPNDTHSQVRLPHTSSQSTQKLTKVLSLLEGAFNPGWLIHTSRHDLFRGGKLFVRVPVYLRAQFSDLKLFNHLSQSRDDQWEFRRFHN